MQRLSCSMLLLWQFSSQWRNCTTRALKLYSFSNRFEINILLCWLGIFEINYLMRRSSLSPRYTKLFHKRCFEEKGKILKLFIITCKSMKGLGGFWEVISKIGKFYQRKESEVVKVMNNENLDLGSCASFDVLLIEIMIGIFCVRCLKMKLVHWWVILLLIIFDWEII